MEIVITIIIIALFVALVAALIAKRRWDLLTPVLFGLVTDAEREYGGGTGTLKLAKVIEWVLPYIPALVRPFVTEKKLADMIGFALDKAKIRWSSNPRLIGDGE